MPPTEDTEVGFDLDAGVSEMASSMGLGGGREDDDEPEHVEETPAGEVETPAPDATLNGSAPAPPATPTVREPPKSWIKDQHERWAKIDPETQAYIELREKQFLDGIEQYKGDAGYGKAIRDVMQPYQQVIQESGLDAPRAVQYLLNAHMQLTKGTPEQRLAAYRKLGANLGFDKQEPGGAQANQLPPELQKLTERLGSIESALTERERAEYQQHHERVSREVEQFASDVEKHPYFDECADDIALFIKAGHELQDAYDRAVMANPVTRAKELARIQTETEAKLRGKAEQDVAAARRTAGGNVRGVENPKAPTEPKGSMEDTMRDTLRKINARSH